jgi:dipeptidyl aminopeptidase/acylaminoacyl peptidase
VSPPAGIGLALALVAILASPAQAAFPGSNGRIAFTSDRDGNGNIFSALPDGSGLTRLTTDPRDDAQAAWSPDGRRIAFRSRRDGQFEVYVMGAAGSDQTRLTTTLTGTATNPPSSTQPSWSPDGRRLLFRSNRDGDYDIWVMDADGSDVEQVLNDPGDERYPGFSPDGRKIVFRSDRDGDPEIFVMDANGTNIVQLTSNDLFDSAPAWSPDGTQIAFERAVSETGPGHPTYEIWVMDADGFNQRQLTVNSTHDEGPAWSPDGTQIAFTTERDGNSEIYRMSIDGSDPGAVTPDPALEESPDWQPIPVSEPPPSGSPVLHSLTVTPRRFRARRAGGSIGRSGARVRYRLDDAVPVIFRVERKSLGGRLRLRGSFRHGGRRGRNAFRFTGRLRGRRLRPGEYYLVAEPRAAGASGVARRFRFAILRG